MTDDETNTTRSDNEIYFQKAVPFVEISFVTKRTNDFKITMVISCMYVLVIYHLSSYGLVVRKKLGKKSDCNSSWHISFSFYVILQIPLVQKTWIYSLLD